MWIISLQVQVCSLLCLEYCAMFLQISPTLRKSDRLVCLWKYCETVCHGHREICSSGGQCELRCHGYQNKDHISSLNQNHYFVATDTVRDSTLSVCFRLRQNFFFSLSLIRKILFWASNQREVEIEGLWRKKPETGKEATRLWLKWIVCRVGVICAVCCADCADWASVLFVSGHS